MFEGLVLAAGIMTGMGVGFALTTPRTVEPRDETRAGRMKLTLQGYAIRSTVLIFVAVGFRVWEWAT